jgi:NTE family protein
MREGDILVSPDLTGIGMLDFERADEIFQRGYDATMAMREQLGPLALSPDDWSAYLAGRTLQRREEPVIDHIAIANDSPLRDDLIRARLSQQVGEPLDRVSLREDLATIYALDHWQLIDYEVVKDPSLGEVLQVNAQAKAWGADRFKVKFNIASALDGSSEINVGASYLWPGLTDLGGELFARGQIGDTVIFSGEFYQPLDVLSRFFIAPYLNYRDYDVTTLGPEFGIQEAVGIWQVRRLIAQFDAGVNLFDQAQLRLGLFNSNGKYDADVEIGGGLPEGHFEEGGVMLSAIYDKMDNPFFPTRGVLAYADYRAMLGSFGSDTEFERWQAIGQAAFSFGKEQRNTLILTGKTGQSHDAPNEPQNFYQLGGLFNLSGLSQDYFSGRQMAFAMAQYQRRLSDTSVLPFDMPVYLGASIEGGQLWSDRADITTGEFINAGSVYFVVDSPLGPIYLAYGRSEDAKDAIYLSLGWPFLRNQMRMGR